MADSFLRLPAVTAVCGLGRSSIYRAMNAGSFPRNVKLGRRAVAWRASEVQAWVDKKIQDGKTAMAAPKP